MYWGNAKDAPLIPPHHPLFLKKKINFYYKGVIRGDEFCMCRRALYIVYYTPLDWNDNV
jgi:hypothetical protein